MPPRTTFDLELSVVIAARPATIFRYFKDPARFSEWLSARASFEAHAGSALRIEFPPNVSADCPDGSVMSGEVLEVDESRHFAFTWGCEGDACGCAFPTCASTGRSPTHKAMPCSPEPTLERSAQTVV